MRETYGGTPDGHDRDQWERDVVEMEARYSAALTEEEVALSLWNEAREYEKLAYERWRGAVQDSELAFDLFVATIDGAIGGSDL